MKKTQYIIIVLLLLLSSCGSNEASWQKTKEGIKIWAPSAGVLNNYHWNGSERYGYAHGEGELTRSKFSGEILDTKFVVAQYGLINTGDTLMIDGLVYWGSQDDSEMDGEGVIRLNDSTFVLGQFDGTKADSINVVDEVGNLLYVGGWKKYSYWHKGVLYDRSNHLVYKGDFKKGLFNGQGTLYYNNGSIRYKGSWKNGLYNGHGVEYSMSGDVLYDGKFKDGLYNGYGLIRLANGSLEGHVWNYGSRTHDYDYYYSLVNARKDKMSSEQYIRAKKQLSLFEHYDYYAYALALLLHILLIILMVTIYRKYCYEAYWYAKTDKIKTGPYLFIWLLSGLLGTHRFALGSLGGIVSLALYTILLTINMPDLIAFFGLYDLNVLFQTDITFYTSIVCAALMLLIWLMDGIWIAYRVYYLNSKYYRYDCREKIILKNHRTDVDDMIADVKKSVPEIIKDIDKGLSSAKSIKSEKKEHSTMIGKFLKLGEKTHLEEQNNRIREVASNMHREVVLMQEYINVAFDYLQEARVNAYRNLNLAKEIIVVFRDVNSRQQVIHADQLRQQNVSRLALQENPDIEISFDYNKVQNDMQKLSNALELFGVNKSSSNKIGGTIAVAIEGINMLYQRNQAMLALSQSIKNNVDQLQELSEQSIEMESQLLRIIEVLEALNKANAAFLQCYTPIRDKVFGDPSVRKFIRGVDKKTDYVQSFDFKKDITYLMDACKEYNKINNSKIN